MSNTLHIHTKHVVEYKDSGEFNHKFSEFKEILDSLYVDLYCLSDLYGSFEVSKEQLKGAIDSLQRIVDGGDPDDVDKDDVLASVEFAGKTPQDIIKLFNWMLENAAPYHDVVFVDFF